MNVCRHVEKLAALEGNNPLRRSLRNCQPSRIQFKGNCSSSRNLCPLHKQGNNCAAEKIDDGSLMGRSCKLGQQKLPDSTPTNRLAGGLPTDTSYSLPATSPPPRSQRSFAKKRPHVCWRPRGDAWPRLAERSRLSESDCASSRQASLHRHPAL